MRSRFCYRVSALTAGLAVLLTAGSAFAQGSLTTLYTFHGADGANPYAALLQASDGNLYGVTHVGGANNFGSIFRITTAGTLTTLYSFNGTDGSNPSARLIQAADGSLYGTTIHGGANGFGTIFKIT